MNLLRWISLPRTSIRLARVSGLFLGLMLTAAPALAGPNAGGTLVVHDTGFLYTIDSDVYPSPAPDCDQIDNQVDPEVMAVWKVYAAFPAYDSPRLKALAWGITLTPGVVVLIGGLPDPASDFEITQGGWPYTDGAGIGMSFGTTQTAHMVECYWFGGYAPPGTQTFGTTHHPTQVTEFVDDSIPGHVDLIAGHSTLGFGQPGLTTCPSLEVEGACCYPDGHCEYLEYAACSTGDWRLLTPCDPNPCAQPFGACCFPDGHCAHVQQATCPTGDWRAFTPCDPNPCPPPLGACCYPDGHCEHVLQPDCSTGDWRMLSPCVPNPCPPPLGACCYADGHCSYVPASGCSTGDWRMLVPCNPNPCPQPFGACCFSDGACQMLFEDACLAGGGTFHGGECDPNPCPQTGACCQADGTCLFVTMAECQTQGGNWLGAGTSCEPNPCPTPVGACCFGSGTCQVLSGESCAASGGTYYGGPCVPNPCPQPPPPGPGDTIADAVVIPGLPYFDTGNTCGYVNDYDEVCPYSGSLSPDLVYAYAPAQTYMIGLDLCAALYDTKIYVYQDAVGNLVGCNDDAGCGYSGWQARIEMVDLIPGHTYYIVIDGYGGSCGDYVLSIVQYAPCVVECPAGSLEEGEPPCVDNYYDLYDGGCNSTGWVEIQAQANGCATMCGKSCTYLYNGLSYRDTDWYTCIAIGGYEAISCTAAFPLQLIFVYGADCSNLQYQYDTAPACTELSIQWYMAPNVEFWPWVGPSVFTGVPESDYTLEVCGIAGGTPTEVMSWGSVKARFLEPPARPESGQPLSVEPVQPTTKPAGSQGTPGDRNLDRLGVRLPPKPGHARVR